MNLVCLWVPSNHDLTALSLRLDIGHLYLRPAWGKRFLVFIVGRLEVHGG